MTFKKMSFVIKKITNNSLPSKPVPVAIFVKADRQLQLAM
jgi:hypothetical protein